MTAQTVTQAVAKRETGPVSIMWGRGKHFESILPDHIEVKGFLGTAAAALYGNDELMKAAERSPDSLIQALMRCASLGHRPGTEEFYLVPRKKKGIPEVQGIEGYRGIVERMYRSGAVASVVVREVCEKDEFEFVEGVHDKPQHSVNWFAGSRGQMIGVYAYAVLTTGAVSRVVILSKDDVMAAREASDSKDSGYSPWNRLDGGKDHPEFTGRSMWWKTAARRLEPWVPTSAEYRREQLRAAAAAVTAPPPAPETVSRPASPDIVDGEVVDEPGPAAQVIPPASEPPSEAPAPPVTRAASKAASDRLAALAEQVLGTWPEDDVTAMYERITGDQWAATASQVKEVAGLLDDALAAAQGDGEAASASLWRQFHPAGDQ